MSDLFINVILSAIYTWGLGLLPSYLIRFKIFKKPLKIKFAILIAFMIWAIHIILSAMIRDISGVGGKPSSALNLVAMISFYILIKKNKIQISDSKRTEIEQKRKTSVSLPKCPKCGREYAESWYVCNHCNIELI